MRHKNRPYWITSGLIFIIAFVLALILIPRKKQDRIKVGLLITDVSYQEELDSLTAYLNSYPFFDYNKIILHKNEREKLSLEDYDVLWYHQLDTNDIPSSLDNSGLNEQIKKYLQKGGKMLLTMDGIKYLNSLKVENSPITSVIVEAKDYGYGRKRGLHAYKRHPVFKDMHGGSYIFSPKIDTTARQLGFMGSTVPENGKVIAVDWAYINLKEDKKLMVEYNIGKGKIMGIGAYTLFHVPNYHKIQLETFMNNIFGYLTGIIEGKKYYWDYNQNKVEEFSINTDKAELPGSSEWKNQKWKLKFEHKPTDNFWDVAGERMLIMGKENKGIEEIWAHPFMALRDYEVGLRMKGNDSINWLSETIQKVKITPNAFIRTYKFGNNRLKETITADIKEPLGAIHYEFKGEKEISLVVKFKTRMRFMWPYSSKVTGKIRYSWSDKLNAFLFTDRTGDLVSIAGATKKPVYQKCGQFDTFSLNKNQYTEEKTSELMAGAIAEFKLNPSDNLEILVAATNEGLEETVAQYRKGIQDPTRIYENSKEYYSRLLTQKLNIQSPDEDFNEAYKWAIIGSDRFFVHTPGLGKSLVAGYATTAKGWDGGHEINGRPGYAWYFGRDGQWSGFALDGYGDQEKVKDILKIYIDFQNLNGKIFHELTTSGAVHYDAADATPLFIVLAGHYLRHSGDEDFIKDNWEHIKKAIDFCFSTDQNNDHLIENTLVGHGWVEGGHLFGGRSTLYLAGCWAAALEEAVMMAKTLNKEKLAEKYHKESETVKEIINTTFWNEDKKFFHHSIREDGSFIEDVTVMPAIPLYYEQIEQNKQELVLRRFATNNFSSDWGMRIASMESEHFNPRGYHTGSVWPLYTGWTALAEYKNDRPTQGYMHTMNNLWVYKHWAKGFVEEVLHGLKYQPSGVCAHQCWSETMALQPLIEGMLGYKPNAPNNTVQLTPALPPHWDKAQISNIKMAEHSIDFSMNRTDKGTEYHFRKETNGEVKIHLNPFLEAGSHISSITINGKPTEYNIRKGNNFIQPKLNFSLEKDAVAIIEHTKGINVLPIKYHPQPGDSSSGLRIISLELKENTYLIQVEGPAYTKKDFMIWCGEKEIHSVNGGNIAEGTRPIIKIEVEFDGSLNKKSYVTKKIEIKLKP